MRTDILGVGFDDLTLDEAAEAGAALVEGGGFHYAVTPNPEFLLAARHDEPFRQALLGADLVCSGHAHGGIIRLPFTDGLFSHDLDLFPSHTAGLYEENGACLFVTRGLGNSGPSFRVFNRPEVAVVTLRRAAD